MPADLSAILGKLSSVPKYHPFEADTFADWALEAGDIVTVRRGDTSYQSPVHSTTFKWNGSNQMTLHSTGARERESIAKISQKKYARSGSGIRNTQGLFNEIFSEDGKLYASFKFTSSILCARMTDYYNGLMSYIELTASRLYLEFKGWYDGLTSNLEFTRSRLRVEFYGLYDGLSSNLELTRSNLRVEFHGLYDGLESNLELTRSNLRVEFYGLYDGLESHLELTRSRLRVEFYGLYDGLESNLELTRSRLRVEFYGLYDGLESNLELTRSRLRVEFYGLYDGLESNLELTRSRLYVTFKGLYDGLESHLELTRSRLYITFSSMYDGLSSNLELTRSRLRIEFFGLYDGLGSNLELTRSRLRVEFFGLYDGLSSNLEFTRSRLRVEFFGLYDGLSSNLEFTRSRLRVEFFGLYDGLSSNLELTRSNLRVEFRGLYDGLESHLELTRSNLALNFKGLYDGLESRLEVTRSSLSFTVNNNYDFLKSQISVHSSKIALVVSGTGQNAKIKAAEIVAAINDQTGQSTVRLSADKIALDGDTTLSGALTIDGSGRLQVHKVLVVGTSQGSQTIINNGTITAPTYQVGSSGSILFIGTQTGENYTLDTTALKSMVKTITHAGNVLTITKWNGDVINFSKATTLSGAWSGGKYTVTARQNTVEVATHSVGFNGSPNMQLTLSQKSAATQLNSTNFLEIPVKVESWETQSGAEVGTERYNQTLTVDATVMRTAGQNDVTLTEDWGTQPASSPASNSNSYTVSTSGRPTALQKSKTFYLSAPGSFDTSTNKKNVYLSHTNTNESNRLAVIEVDASSIRTAGQNDVTLTEAWGTQPTNSPTSNSNSYTVSTSGRSSALQKSKTFYLSAPGSFDSTTHKKTVYLSHSNTNEANRLAKIELDASGVYSDGQTAAGLTYSAGTAKISRSLSSATKEYYITVKPYSGTASQGTVISVDSSQFNSSYKAGVQVRLGTDNTDNGVLAKLYSVNFDVSTIASDARTAGKNDVGLTESWGTNPTSSPSSNSNSYTVETTGRPSKITMSKTFYLSRDDDFDTDHKRKVYLSHTNSSASNRLAYITVDASSVYSAGQTATGISYDTTYNKVVRSLSSSVKEYYLTVKTGTGEATAGTLDVAVNSFDSSHKAFANVRIGTYATGSGSGVSNAGVVTTPYSIQIDATSEYNTGKDDGKTSVTLPAPTWSEWQQSGLPATRTVTVRTSGRAHGSVNEAEQPITLTLEQGSTSGKTIYVNLKCGSSYYARLSVDASSIYTNGWNAARDSVGAFPTLAPSNFPATMTVRMPGNVDGNPVAYQYQVAVDNDYAYIQYKGGNNVTNNVARTPNNVSINVSLIGGTDNPSSSWTNLGSDTGGYMYRIIRVNGNDYYMKVKDSSSSSADSVTLAGRYNTAYGTSLGADTGGGKYLHINVNGTVYNIQVIA